MKSRERSWQTYLQKRLLSFWDIAEEQFSVTYAFESIKRKKLRK